MYTVSDNYKEQNQQFVRNPSYVKVKFEIIDPQAKADAELSSNSNSPYSAVSVVKDDLPIAMRYDTLEHNQFILDDGIHKLGTATYGDYQGYVSGSFSGSDCVFTTPPKIAIAYDTFHAISGFSLVFDEIRGDYASEIQIIAYSNGVSVYNATFQNNSINFLTEDGIPSHNSMEIYFKKTSLPYKRCKIELFWNVAL